MTRVMLVTLLAVTLTILVLYRRKKTPQERKLFIFKVLLSVLIVSLIYLTLTGKMHFLVAMGAAILPFISRLLPLIKYIPVLRNFYQQKKASQQSSDDKTSTVETSLLTMTLHHATGQMEGLVRTGRLAEKKLSECSTEQLFELYQLAENNHLDSLSVFVAYLDREIGEQWRQDFEALQNTENTHTDHTKQTNNNEMNTSEALDILGVNSDASREEIIAAHRKLIQKFHPDRGGSNYLAAKLNQAKALLLNQL